MQALNDTPPTKPVVSVLGRRPASFVRRRVAHETAIHRWDAQNAAGHPDGFEPAVAVDGIDEMMELWIPRAFNLGQFGGRGQTIQLEGIDGDASWLITVEADRTEWRRGHNGADVSARGRLGDLYLFVWSRLDPAELEVRGELEMLRRWQEAARV